MDRQLLARVEGAARGWALLVSVVLTVSLPLVWFEARDDGRVVDEYGTLWSTVPRVLFTDRVDYVTADTELSEVSALLLVARIGVVLLLLGVLAAAAVALTWIDGGEVARTPRWLRGGVAASLVGGALFLGVGAGQVPDLELLDGATDGGIGAGAGLWAPLLSAFVLGLGSAPRA